MRVSIRVGECACVCLFIFMLSLLYACGIALVCDYGSPLHTAMGNDFVTNKKLCKTVITKYIYVYMKYSIKCNPLKRMQRR